MSATLETPRLVLRPLRADDPEVLAQAAEGLRATLQGLVDEDVAARRSVFL